MQSLSPQISIVGEHQVFLGVPVVSDPEQCLHTQSRIWQLAHKCQDRDDVLETVPGMNNLTLRLSDNQDPEVWCRWLESEFQRTASIEMPKGREHIIPVAYGGEEGPDLQTLASRHGLNCRDIIRLHTQGDYRVLFIGFLPGFPYLSGLPNELHTPRLATPRQAVPAGSVGIGGAQTGIYPCKAPGGWHLIGRTHIELFDPKSNSPCLLSPGDRVIFVEGGYDA